MAEKTQDQLSYLDLTEEIYTRAFAQAVADRVFVVNKDGNFLDVKMNNGDAENFVPLEGYKGKNIYDIDLDFKVADNFKACILRTIIKKELQIYRYELDTGQKTIYNEARFFYLDGERVLVINRNITPLVRVTDQLFNNQAILRSIIDNYEDSIFSVNSKQEYIVFNKAHEIAMMKKYGVKIAAGHKMSEYIDVKEDLGLANEYFENAMQGESMNIEHEFGSNSLFRGMTQICVFPLHNYEQNIIGVTVFTKDRTIHHKAREEKDKYLQTLESILADLSHKIRRPVASMLGLVQLADEVRSPEEMDKLLNFFRESVEEMDEYIKQMSKTLEENRSTYQ